MEDFLDALTPAMRERVSSALAEDPDNRVRLTAVVSRYVDEDGGWPTDSDTADMLARTFLHTVEDIERQYSGAGLSETVVAGLAGGALALAQGRGAMVLSSKLMSDYWLSTLAYATGIDPVFIRSVKKVMDDITDNPLWEELTKNLSPSYPPDAFSMTFGVGYERMLEREVLGALKKSAWRGARSAINHISGGRIGDYSQENPWVETYVANFARNQHALANRTVREILNRGMEQNLPPKAMAERLREGWNLTPRYAQAVENYRKTQIAAERSPREIRNSTQAYAQRLLDSRLSTMAQTESMQAFHLAREAQWMKAVNAGTMPLDTVKMWVTAQDELVCKVCRPMDGSTAALGTAFTGEVTLMAPTAHPNCRCIIVPVSAGIADVSSSPRLVFPSQSVSKHLGGGSEPPRPHPSGSPQSVHGGDGGGLGGGGGRSFADRLNNDEWDALDTTATGLALGSAIAFSFATRNPMAVNLARRGLGAARPLPHAAPGSFMRFDDALRFDRNYQASARGWRDLDELGSALRQNGYRWGNTAPDHAGRIRHILRTAGTRSAMWRNTDRNLVARVGSHYHGSTATNPTITGIQKAAQKVFGLDDATTAHFAKGAFDPNKAFRGKGYDDYIKAQFNQTQKHLARRGVEQVPVMRGMKMKRADAEAMGLDVVSRAPRPGQSVWQKVEMTTQPLNSVTTSPVIANRYATGITGTAASDEVAVVMRRIANRDEVFANYKTGLGMRRWQEWIIKGGKQEWEVVAVDPKLISSHTELGRRAAVTPNWQRQWTMEDIWNS